ncbi:hypothetical protein [Vibrio breoganii]|uniref:hypothetical protein n=1 Tax=Vibrio breoganii TaxID=553239 RepID=UPI0012FFF970|nr:hypothetical protein [Vibrio breoganii]
MEFIIQIGIYWFGVSIIGGMIGKLFGAGFWRSFFISGGVWMIFYFVKIITRPSNA